MIFPLELEKYERIAYQHTENVEKTKKLMVQFVIEAIFESSNDIPKCNETLFGKICIEMNMY